MNALFDKIYGALIGSAIGDAMGGPVEGLHFSEIAEKFGRVESLLPYTEVSPGYHGPFSKVAGAYTDDTRLSILFANAAIHAGGIPMKGDIAHSLAEYYFLAKTELERGFIEEYYLKGLYGDSKEVFGGRPTNGGIMGIAPLGAIFPCDPEEAFSHVFKNLFISTGTARSASAFAAAMIAAAMRKGTDWKKIMNDSFMADKLYKHSVEAGSWRNSSLYPIVAVKTEQMAEKAMELGSGAANVFSFQRELYDVIVQPFFADASESLAIAVAMFCAAEGDFALTVKGCVNFGRDNDSSAAVGGAVAGALCGASNIPAEWITTVENANPKLSEVSLQNIRETAEVLTGITMKRYNRQRNTRKSGDDTFFSTGKNMEKEIVIPGISDAENSRISAALADGADPDQVDDTGKTTLQRACASGRSEAASMLLMYGADADLCDKNKTTPLHFAAWNNHHECVLLLLKFGADPDLAEGGGWTAIHDAIRQEYTDIIFTILQKSRNAHNIEAVREKTEKCSGDERFSILLELLADNQVSLNSVGICGQSLLHDAVERGYTESVKILLKYGADVNQIAFSLEEKRFEGSPLHKAAAWGQEEIYKLLILSGADESAVNINGKTPPELWKQKGDHSI